MKSSVYLSLSLLFVFVHVLIRSSISLYDLAINGYSFYSFFVPLVGLPLITIITYSAWKRELNAIRNFKNWMLFNILIDLALLIFLAFYNTSSLKPILDYQNIFLSFKSLVIYINLFFYLAASFLLYLHLKNYEKK